MFVWQNLRGIHRHKEMHVYRTQNAVYMDYPG